MKTLREQIADRYDDVRDSDLVEYDPYLDGCQTCFRLHLIAICNYPNSTLKAIYRRDSDGNYIKLPEKKLTWSEQLKRAGAVEYDYAVSRDTEGHHAVNTVYDHVIEGRGETLDYYLDKTLTSLHRIDQSTGELVKVWPA